MKKIAFVSGIVSANLMMFGSLFKVFHWPFADKILIIATIIFCLLFLPSALISWYQTSESKPLLLTSATFIVFFTGVIAILFKIEHWQYDTQVLLFAFPLPFVVFLPLYINHIKKDKHDNTFIPVMLGLTFIAVFSVLLSVH
ncbi:MAG: hypothetical protein ABI840_12240 [bacterium]